MDQWCCFHTLNGDGPNISLTTGISAWLMIYNRLKRKMANIVPIAIVMSDTIKPNQSISARVTQVL